MIFFSSLILKNFVGEIAKPDTTHFWLLYSGRISSPDSGVGTGFGPEHQARQFGGKSLSGSSNSRFGLQRAVTWENARIINNLKCLNSEQWTIHWANKPTPTLFFSEIEFSLKIEKHYSQNLTWLSWSVMVRTKSYGHYWSMSGNCWETMRNF